MAEPACRKCTRKICRHCCASWPDALVAFRIDNADRCVHCAKKETVLSDCKHYHVSDSAGEICKECKQCLRCVSVMDRKRTDEMGVKGFRGCTRSFEDRWLCLQCHRTQHLTCAKCGDVRQPEEHGNPYCLPVCSSCDCRICSSCQSDGTCLECRLAHGTGGRCEHCDHIYALDREAANVCIFCHKVEFQPRRQCRYCRECVRTCCQHVVAYQCSRCPDKSGVLCSEHCAACITCLGVGCCTECVNSVDHRRESLSPGLLVQCPTCEGQMRELFAESSQLPTDLQKLLYHSLFDTLATARDSQQTFIERQKKEENPESGEDE